MTPSDYKTYLYAIRPFVNGFDASDGFDIRRINHWEPWRKGMVTRYFNLIYSLSQKPHVFKRFRTKGRTQQVNRAMGIVGFPRLATVIIQVPSGKVAPEVRISRSGAVTVVYKGVGRAVLLFSDYGISQDELATDPDAAIDILMDYEQDNYDKFSILAGEFEVGFWDRKRTGSGVTKFYGANEIRAGLKKLMDAYSSENFDPDNSASSYYGNWLRGLMGYKFRPKGAILDYARRLGEYRRQTDKINEEQRRLRESIRRWKKLITHYKRIKLARGEKKKRIDNLKKKIDNANAYINELKIQKIKLR